MKINKHKKERALIRRDITKLVKELKAKTKQSGLLLSDNYFAQYLGINLMSFNLMINKKKLPLLLQAEKRLARLKELKAAIDNGKLPL